jgi:hypothetical protein
MFVPLVLLHIASVNGQYAVNAVQQRGVMPLKLRPTGLGSGTYKDNVDYSVFSGEWLIGRIYERNGFPDEVRFFWSLHGVVLTHRPASAPMALLRIWRRRRRSFRRVGMPGRRG